MNNHNRRIVTWLIAGVLTLCIAIAVAQTRCSSVGRLPRIEFGEVATVCWPSGLVERVALPATPSAISVYRVQSIPSRKALMLKLFRALPIPPTPKNKVAINKLARTPESVLMDGIPKDAPLCETIGDWEVEVSPDGRFRASRSLRYRSAEAKPAPPDAQVRKVADAFLSPIRPLMPRKVRFSAVRTGEAISEIAHGKVVDRVIMRRAAYNANLGGIPVDGVYVEVVAGAKVVAMGSSLRHLVAARKVPILSPKEALQKVRAHEAHLDDGEGGTGYVDSIKLMYWNRGAGKDNKLTYVVPVYVFEGESIYEDKQAKRTGRGRWKAFVEAIRPEFLETGTGA